MGASETWAELLVGILLAFGGSTIANLGMNLQKLSHERNAGLPGEEQRSYLKRPLWVIGFAVFLLGQVALMASLGFADQATCSVLGNLALISNACFARCFFGELFTKFDCAAMFCIVGGSSFIIGFFHHADQNFSVVELEQSLGAAAFLILVSALVVVLAVCMRRHRIAGAAATPALNYSIMASIIGGFSLTFGKVTMQLVKATAAGENQFDRLWTFLVAILFIACAVANVHVLNQGLANCEAMVLIPMYYNLNNLVTTALGIVAFKDFETFREALPTLMFFAGLALCCAGVAVLSKKKQKGRGGSRASRDDQDGEIDVDIGVCGGGGGHGGGRTSDPEGNRAAVVPLDQLDLRLGEGTEGRSAGRGMQSAYLADIDRGRGNSVDSDGAVSPDDGSSSTRALQGGAPSPRHQPKRGSIMGGDATLAKLGRAAEFAADVGVQGAQRIAGKAGEVAGRVVAVARGRTGSSYGVVGTRDTDTALV